MANSESISYLAEVETMKPLRDIGRPLRVTTDEAFSACWADLGSYHFLTKQGDEMDLWKRSIFSSFHESGGPGIFFETWHLVEE